MKQAQKQREAWAEQLAASNKMQAEQHEKERQTEKREKLADKIPPYKQGTDIETFLTSLEAQLAKLQIPKDDWSNFLIAKLPGETSSLITDLIGTDTNYSDFRIRLYNRVDTSHVAAGMKLFSSWVPDFNDRKVWECSTQLIAFLVRPCRIPS